MTSTDFETLAANNPEHAAELLALARRQRAEENAAAEEDARLAELYREPTAEELASVAGVTDFVRRFDALAVGPDAVVRLLSPVAEALGRLAQTSGEPTPGRGPVPLTLNLAKSEISRAIAVSRTTRHDLAAGYVATGLGFLLGLRAGQGAAVGSG